VIDGRHHQPDRRRRPGVPPAGRFDREIFIGPPDVGGAAKSWKSTPAKMPLADSAQEFLDEIAKRTHGFLAPT